MMAVFTRCEYVFDWHHARRVVASNPTMIAHLYSFCLYFSGVAQVLYLASYRFLGMVQKLTRGRDRWEDRFPA